MFMPQPGLPADPAAALAALRGQLSGPQPLPAMIDPGYSARPMALPPAVQAAVDRGEMNPADARARVMANRPGFGGGQTPGIVPSQAGGGKPMAKPASRGGTPTGQVPPTQGFRQPKPAVEPPIPGPQPMTGGPLVAPPAPEAPMQAQNGGGFQSGPLLPNGQPMQSLQADEPAQGGPKLPNGMPMGGQNPAYQGQMLGAMRSMFR